MLSIIFTQIWPQNMLRSFNIVINDNFVINTYSPVTWIKILGLHTASSKFKYRNVFNTLSYFFKSEKTIPTLNRAFNRVSEYFFITVKKLFSVTRQNIS